MPVPEDMRRTVKVQLRLSEPAARILRSCPVGQRSSYVSALIVAASGKRKRAAQPRTSGPATEDKMAKTKGNS